MKKSKPGRLSHDNYMSTVTCSCGKRGFWERDDAKRAIKNLRRRGVDPESDLLKTYRCEQSGGLWHVGHRRRIPADTNDPRLWLA